MRPRHFRSGAMRAPAIFAPLACLLLAGAAPARGAPQGLPGESPALPRPRLEQARLAARTISVRELRRTGLEIFTAPFNRLDGFGEGVGLRPTLQGNGTFLRVNGLDSQTCVDCHSVGSTRTRPPRAAAGGVGGAAQNVFFGPRNIDVDDSLGNGFAFFDGRFSNPLFLFGAGGVELVGKEMTVELQALRAVAQANPGVPVPLVAKGISFGSLTWNAGVFDTSAVEGIGPDLVVRPFSRKGDFTTARDLTVTALSFHHGIQAVEFIGAGNDGDFDGVVDELLVGEMSALHAFVASLERPFELAGGGPSVVYGRQLFDALGCAECHVPVLETESARLPLCFPEVDADPFANAYWSLDLQRGSAGFEPNGAGGVSVRLYSDLKRHDMGPALAESTGVPSRDPYFLTTKLWGAADSGPWLHDGRALTLSDAILLHGGEGQPAADGFAQLGDAERRAVLAFLRTLRTPEAPSADIAEPFETERAQGTAQAR